jgi:hypothetical protein
MEIEAIRRSVTDNIPITQGEPSQLSERYLEICDDGGYTLRYVTERDKQREPVLAAAGTPFAINPDLHGHSLELGHDTAKKLKQIAIDLRKKSKTAYSSVAYYIPITDLEKILSRDTIRGILPALAKDLGEEKFDAYADMICPPPASEDKPPTSYRKILAILILMQKSDKIGDFVEGEISDDKLPLRRIGEERPFKLGIKESSDPPKCFEEWGDHDIESFDTMQYQMLAPFFALGRGDRVHHYVLSDRRPLPFERLKGDTKGTEVPDQLSGNTNDEMAGGFGKVTGVTIDPAHHKLPSYTASLCSIQGLDACLYDPGMQKEPTRGNQTTAFRQQRGV